MAINWNIVDDELSKVAQEFKDPKFYALKHVVEILTSSNPQQLVGQLRDQEQRLAALVDKMVQGYHGGFAKSIQNYSQILQLFGDAKEQVDGLKKALADASRQLSTQSRTLQQQWRKSLTLEASLKLLDDIQLVVDAPGRIDGALLAKEWSAAVDLLLEACSKLARDELAKVGAVGRLKQDMLAISIAIQGQLVQELHNRVYTSTVGLLQQHFLTLRNSQQLKQTAAFPALTAATVAGRHTALAGSAVTSASMPAAVKDALNDRLQVWGETDQGSKVLQVSQQQKQVGAPAQMAELVGCLLQLDALDDAKLQLMLLTRSGVRGMVFDVTRGWADKQQQVQQQQTLVASPGFGFGWPLTTPVQQPLAGRQQNSSSRDTWALPTHVQQAVQKLLQAVFDSSLRALANLGALHQGIATASSSGSNANGGSSSTGSSSERSTAVALTVATKATGASGGASSGGAVSNSALQLLKQQQQQQQSAGDRSRQVGDASTPTASSNNAFSPPAAAAAAVTVGLSGLGQVSLGGLAGQQQRQQQVLSEKLRAAGSDPVEYLQQQYAHVWQQMQEECLLLLAELLRANLQGQLEVQEKQTRQGGWLAEFAEIGEKARGQLLEASGTGSSGGASSTLASKSASLARNSHSVTAAAAVEGSSTSGTAAASPLGLSSGSVTDLNPKGSSQLKFKFSISAAGLGTNTAAAAAAGQTSASTAAAAADSTGYGVLLARGLAEGYACPYLAPTVYSSVNGFVDNAFIVMSEACSSSGGSSLATSWCGPAWLRQSLEDYLLQGFLPQLYVDLRGRCTAVLEDPDAFTPHAFAVIRSSSSSSYPDFNQRLLHSIPTASAAAAAASASAAGVSAGNGPCSVVAAAGFGVQVTFQVTAWLPVLPLAAATALIEVLDAILRRLLEALAANIATTLEGTKTSRVAMNPNLALLMATEPDAILLVPEGEHPFTFFVPPRAVAAAADGSSGNRAGAAAAGISTEAGSSGCTAAAAAATDGSGVGTSSGLGFAAWAQPGFLDGNSFLAALKSPDKPVLVPGIHRPILRVYGLGLEGEAAADEVLLYCLHERPVSSNQVLAANRPGVLVQLAALSDSCDWLAGQLEATAAATEHGGSLAPGSLLGRRQQQQQQQQRRQRQRTPSPTKHGSREATPPRRGTTAAVDGSDFVSGVLKGLSNRYRSLAGACSRALRLDLLLLTAHHIHGLASVSHLCEEEDVKEVHPCVGALTRQVTRAAEELCSHLPQHKVDYVFGAVATAAAKYTMWALQDIDEINTLGVERIICSLAAMQGPLSSLGAASGTAGMAAAAAIRGPDAVAAQATPAGGSSGVGRAYDRAKSYFTLVGLPADEVIRLAADKPGRFSLAEWEALLQVQVPGRPTHERHMAALHRALDKYYHISAGQKMADFFEDVGAHVREPILTLTDNVSAGFKGGLIQAKALLNKAAEAVTEAAAATASTVERATAAAAAKTKAAANK